MRIAFSCFAALLCAGCVTGETVQFRAQHDQQSIIRDGQAALVSTKKNSIVIARPASRQFQTGGRPVFVVGINNMSKQPQNFLVSGVQVTQVVNGEAAPLEVITYEKLVREEKNRQIFAAVATGLSAGANAYNASQAGHYNSSSTVYTPRGSYQVHTTGYTPTAAAIALSNASAQNAAMISNTIETGQRNLSALEQGVIKDNTLMPGEWYGGQLHIAPLVNSDGNKTYTISVLVGSERHEIHVSQGAI